MKKLLILILSFTSFAFGADNFWLDGKYATGDWDGERAKLLDEGVEPFLYYTAIFSGNPVGGFRQGATYVDDYYFGFNLDLSKLVGWAGGNFTISGVNRDGLGLTDHYIRSRYDVQQTVGGQTIFLYQVFLDQHFWDNKVSLKIGHFGASDDFNGASSIYSRYLNNGVDGDIRNVLFDTQFSAYPFATWAARLRVEPTTDTSVQLGIFQTWQDIFNPSNHGLNWAIRGSDGVFIIAEYGWSPEFWKQPVETTDGSGKDGGTTEIRGLPGHYHIGASISPWNGYAEFGSGRQVSNSYGFYVHGDQMVYQERPGSDEGLTLWAASGYYPQSNISIIPFQVNFGAIYTGLLPGRPHDQTIAGLIYGRFSRDYAQTVKDAGNGDPTYEMVLEGSYRVQFTKFFWVQPDLQWVNRPYGTGRIPNAVVVGAETGITF
ncbi:MAG: carbohydrate porin [Chthoniobacterales bacterium]